VSVGSYEKIHVYISHVEWEGALKSAVVKLDLITLRCYKVTQKFPSLLWHTVMNGKFEIFTCSLDKEEER